MHACATVDGPRNIGGVYAGGVVAISRTRTLVCLAAINNAIKHEFVRLSRATKGGRNFVGEIFAQPRHRLPSLKLYLTRDEEERERGRG